MREPASAARAARGVPAALRGGRRTGSGAEEFAVMIDRLATYTLIAIGALSFGACLVYAVVWCRGEVVPTEAPERVDWAVVP